MPSTFFGLSIGKSGLYASQAAINTTAHNVANATTKGYSRQVVNQSASRPVSVYSRFGMAGTGVNVDSITRERNEYFDEKYWMNNEVYGKYATKEHYMTSIQNYFSEVNSDGTTATFTEFSLALKGLKDDVADATRRTEVTEFGQNFTEFINYLGNGLQKIQAEANNEIKTTVGRINSLAVQIASLNKQINTLEMNGGAANDLRDARGLLLDELSTYANVKVTENPIGEAGIIQSLTIKLDGKTLVDNYEYNQLVTSSAVGKVNQCDIDGLYEVTWSDGQMFNSASESLGGTLQALFEIRDGNNQENFQGTTTTGSVGDTSVTIVDTNCNNISKLALAAEKGTITIGIKEYSYDSFEVNIKDDGKYEYTFHGLKDALGNAGLKEDVDGKAVAVGRSVDYKGIPYYQAQLNEFIRTYASSFNTIHNQGEDLNGNKGKDFFNGTMGSAGCNYDLDEIVTSFSSVAATDADGNVIKTEDGLVKSSYYSLTALNFCISRTILNDTRTIACASNINNGVEEKHILDALSGLQEDKTMFKQGNPAAFLQSFTANIGIDTKQAELFSTSQENILAAIDTQRLSVSSVDKDEEAMSLVKYQSMYELSCKVIQVMDEIFNKLINETGV